MTCIAHLLTSLYTHTPTYVGIQLIHLHNAYECAKLQNELQMHTHWQTHAYKNVYNIHKHT